MSVNGHRPDVFAVRPWICRACGVLRDHRRCDYLRGCECLAPACLSRLTRPEDP